MAIIKIELRIPAAGIVYLKQILRGHFVQKLLVHDEWKELVHEEWQELVHEEW